MGLFDSLKEKFKKKEQQPNYKEIYAGKSLQELEKICNQPWLLSGFREQRAVCSLYVEKLFKCNSSEGGFGISSDLSAIIGKLTNSVCNHGVHSGINQSGNRVILNYEIEFIKNYFLAGNTNASVLNSVWSYFYNAISSNRFSHKDISNIGFSMYNPWIYQGELSFVEYKVKTAIVLNDVNELENFGLFRKINGVPTNEYITIEDFVGFDTQKKVEAFLNYSQTRDPED